MNKNGNYNKKKAILDPNFNVRDPFLQARSIYPA
jgi:hypothetical protein